jgi:iron complex transport system substrate-binding protein
VAAVVLAVAAAALVASCASGPAETAPASASPAGTAAASSTTASTTAAPQAVDGVITITSADVPLPAALDVTPAAGSPERIVSLAAGVGETLAALGLADRVVARDETSDVPAIASAPIVTKAHATSAELVLAEQPDLVIVDSATSPPEAIDQIRSTGVTVVEVPEAWSVTDIGPRTRAVAEAAGLPASAADSVIAAATSGVTVAPPGTPPRVAFLYLRGTSAVYLLGGQGSGADDLIAGAGGIDVGAESGLDAFVPLTPEALVAADPDTILVMTKGLESVGGIDGLVALPGVAQTTAGRERRVIAVDDTLLLSFGPRTGELITRLSAALAESAA